MAQWEYLTLFLEAKVRKEDADNLKKRFDKKRLPKFTPESMIPELDQLGAAGWELVHMEPVAKVGGNGDVLFQGAPRWSHQYFCVFKRPKHVAAPSSRPMSPQEQAAAAPPPPQTPNPALAQNQPPPKTNEQA